MGCLLTNNDDINKRLRFLQCYAGAVPSPIDCFLGLRGLKTLHLRLDAAMRNAIQISHYLNGHPAVDRVIFPGLETYEYKDIFQSQTRGPG